MPVIAIFLLLTTIEASAAQPDDFWKYWGDGKGELSSYRVAVSRYGELREGRSVLIFVTEDISRSTRIKVESNEIPANDRVPVLKLNRVVKFNTGVYDYSILTSIFSSVEPELGRSSFDPMKISFSAQEWCGHVFQMLVPQRNEVQLSLHSYFQGEGDQQRTFKLPKNAAYEDNFPIWIRELKGEVLSVGQRLELQILPSAWVLRSTHKPAAFQNGWILKEDGSEIAGTNGKVAAWRWTWKVGDRTETYWVEKAHPHRILKWESSDGGKGELVESLRLPYWELHGNEDEHYRGKLGLPEP